MCSNDESSRDVRGIKGLEVFDREEICQKTVRERMARDEKE